MQNIKRAQSEALSHRLSKLPVEKRLMFRSKLKQEGIDAWQLPIVPEFDAPEFRKLSYSQQRLWFIDEMEGGKGLYNISFALSIKGELDHALLNQSVNDIIQRHEVLHTNVHNVDGEGRQIVRAFEPLQFTFIDLAKTDDSNDLGLQKIINQEAETPFDLKSAPHMLRITLVKRSGDAAQTEHVAVLAFHHISFDAFSVGLFVDELQQGYAHYQSGGVNDRSHAELLDQKIRLQYADYAHWHSQWLDSGAAEAEKSYWQEQLTNMPAHTIVPTCYPRPEKMTYQGSNQLLRLSTTLTDRIEALLKTEGVTFYMFMLATLNVLLSRQTGQNDISVGSSIANRSRLETQSLLGVFVNTLVMRNKQSDEATFKQFLDTVKQTATDAYTHQELPFDKVVDIAGVERLNNISPLFQVLFVVNNALDKVSIDLNGVEVAPYHLNNQTARFDLTLRVSQETLLSEEPGIVCWLEYNTALYSDERISQLLVQYQTLLSQIVDNVNQPLASLSLLSYQQQQAMQLKGPEIDYKNTASTVQEYIERYAKTRTNKLAVVSGKQRLSYADLNTQANQLANALLIKGVKPEQHIGIFLDRSVEYIISLVAILKAGCAYVPLDKSWPIGRLKMISNDAKLVSIISDSVSAPLVSNIGVNLVLADADLTMYDTNNPALKLDETHSAYLVYTSGSTGAPKGVVVEHAQVFAYANGMLSMLGLEGLIFASVSSVATDLGNTAIYGALCSGGTLNLVSEEYLRDADELSGYLVEHKVEVLKITPSYLQGLLSAASHPENLIPSHTLILGGERCSSELVNMVQKIAPKCRIVNHYGPTETTIGALTFSYSPTELNSDQAGYTQIEPVPIGKPLPNYTAVVIDQTNQPCPVNTPGELMIGGAGVSRGYYGLPELTQDKFVIDFSGNRCYKTGDRARLLPNGCIEFLGRVDDQVKIRGYRVELADIEFCLKQQSEVSNAVVRLQSSAVSQRLIAYVVPKQDLPVVNRTELTESTFNKLAESLPEYMIPQELHLLEEMPLTINGKVDAKALDALILKKTTSEQEGKTVSEPSNEIERTLMEIWRTLLKQDNFGVDDNFFELGGDSILSLQVIAGAKRAGYKLLPKQLFEHQTIAGIALVATPLKGASKASSVQTNAVITGEVVISPIQRWFLNSEHSQAHHWNQSISLQAKEPINAAALALAVSYLVRHHDQLRCEFLIDDFVPRQRLLAWELELGKQYYVTDNGQAKPFSESVNDWQASLSFKANGNVGQLFKVVHFVGDEATSDRLLLVAHHLLVDGISWRVLSEDLLTAYQHAVIVQSGIETSKLPEFALKTESFQAWSLGLKHAAEKVKTTWQIESRDYWGAMFEALSADHALIMSLHTRSTLKDVETINVNLDKETTKALLQSAPKAYKTRINDLLLSALSLAVAKQLGDQPLYLELEGHGREELVGAIEGVDVSRTVGWFTSRFPILLQSNASESCDLSILIRNTKEQLRAIHANGMAYGVLTALGGMLPMPKPTISFNYLGQIDGAQETLAQTFEAVPNAGKAIERHPENTATHGLSINAIVANGELRISFQSVASLLSFDVDQLSEDYTAALQNLVEHCGGNVLGFTPSDFPLANITQKQLDTLTDKADVEQIDNVYGLTSLQEGMLFHTLMDRDSDTDASAYFNQLLVKVEGEFDAAVFANAWQLTLNRHSILRSSFWVQGANEPVQIVHKECDIPIDHQQWQGLTVFEQAAEMEKYLLRDREQGFDLQQAPLMRIGLFELGALHWQVLWSRHHLLLDGWSSTRLLQEVMVTYQALTKGVDPNTHPMLDVKPAPFSQYIEWLQQQDTTKAEVFWKEYFADLHEPPSISLKRSDVGQQFHVVTLNDQLSQQLSVLSKQAQVTLNTVMQAAWGMLLSQYLSAEDGNNRNVVFGMTSAGRSMDLPSINEMLGLFINTLPVHLTLDYQQPFKDYLTTLQLNQAAVREYEYVSLSQIQAWSNIDNGQPLFESLLIFENYMVDDQALQKLQNDEDKLQLSTVSNYETTNYPLTLVVVPGTSQLELRFSSNGLEPNALKTLAEVYQSTLRAMVNADTLAPISELITLPATQAQTLIHDWNATDMPVPSESIEELIRQQSVLNGNAIAASFNDFSISYAKLDERVNRLAKLIQTHGIGPNQLVGIVQQRSVSLLVSVLAVLKSGAAYVPLDPNYPQGRIDYMIEDANLSLLLCDQIVSAAGRLPTGLKCPIINVDKVQHHEPAATASKHSATADDLAYVIYTSGSTGKPKGVKITRGNLTNFIVSMQNLISLSTQDRLLAVTSLSFDIAALELFLPLVSGAQVVIGDENLSMDGSRLKQQMETGISAMQATPVSWRLLLAAGWQHDEQNGCFTALCGGEAFPVDLAQDLLKQRIKVWNMYGPTETTVWSAAYELSEHSSEITHTVPIGRPIGNTKLFILDKRMKPVPIGAVGQLWIGGAGLAQGYLGREDLTNECFIDSEYGRIYQTGDLVRYGDNNGVLECLGRLDNQVKIRGYRIELSEIEQVLMQHENVADVAVQPVVLTGQPILVAYVVNSTSLNEEQETLFYAELRVQVTEQLPGYMVPSMFMPLSALPLTPNGKINRKALPVPDLEGGRSGYQAPDTELQVELCVMWQELLGTKRVGIHDNFFELGGHSLLAIRLKMQLSNDLGFDLSIAQMLSNQTVAELAAVIESQQGSINEGDLDWMNDLIDDLED